MGVVDADRRSDVGDVASGGVRSVVAGDHGDVEGSGSLSDDPEAARAGYNAHMRAYMKKWRAKKRQEKNG
jgi:hypothetical protein